MKAKLKGRIEFEATVGATIAALLASRDPNAQKLGAELLEDLRAWRELHPLKGLERVREKLRARDLKETEAREEKAVEQTKLEERAMQQMRVEGPKLWEELHRRAVSFESNVAHVADQTDELAYEKMKRAEAMFIRQLVSRIPCSTCKRAWSDIIKANPPRFDEYFLWTVEVHNAINEHVGHRIVRIAEARRKWNGTGHKR